MSEALKERAGELDELMPILDDGRYLPIGATLFVLGWVGSIIWLGSAA